MSPYSSSATLTSTHPVLRSFRVIFERPYLIWFLLSLGLGSLFAQRGLHREATPHELQSLENLKQFSEAGIFPRISFVKELGDFGGVSYYALASRLLRLKNVADSFAGREIELFRWVSFLIMVVTSFCFVQLGNFLSIRTRLSPVWVSFGLLVFALNPTFLIEASRVGYHVFFIFLFLLTLRFHYSSRWALMSLFGTLAVLCDVQALLLFLAFGSAHFLTERTFVMDSNKVFYYLLPVFLGLGLILNWMGIMPSQGSVAQWEAAYRNLGQPRVRVDQLSYVFCLLGIYPLWFSWSWFLKSRQQAKLIAILPVVLGLVLYFVFPMTLDWWNVELLTGAAANPEAAWPALGLLYASLHQLVDPYTNLVLVVPFLAGVYLICLMAQFDHLEQSLPILIFLVFHLLYMLFVPGELELRFLLTLVMVMMLSLSEASVGEAGNLAHIK